MSTIRTGLVCLAFAAAAAAGEISGTVYDPSGAVVPSAVVTLRGAAGGASQQATTDPKGDYVFTGLPAGRYRVEVARPGFALTTQGAALAGAGESLLLDLVLRMGSIQESITVERDGVAAPVRQPAPRPRAGGNVQPARVRISARPAFPASSRSAGRVLLQAAVLQDGSVGKVRVIASPDPELAQAASDAVRRMRYEPTTLNGEPVETELQIAIDYKVK